MNERNIHAITLADDDWIRVDDDGNRLTAVLVVNGRFHHLDAIRVVDDDEGIQIAASPELQEMLDAMFVIGADGPFDTVRIRDAEYVLVVTPFQ